MTRPDPAAWKKKTDHLQSLESHLAKLNALLKQTEAEFNKSDLHTEQGHEWQDMRRAWEEQKTNVVRSIVKQLNSMKDDCDPDAPELIDLTEKLSELQRAEKDRLKLTPDEVLKQNLDKNLNNLVVELEAAEPGSPEEKQLLQTLRTAAPAMITINLNTITEAQKAKAQAFENQLSQEAKALNPGSKISALYHRFMDLLIDFKVLIKAIKPDQAPKEKCRHRQDEVSKINAIIINNDNRSPDQEKVLLDTKTRLQSEIATIRSKHNLLGIRDEHAPATEEKPVPNPSVINLRVK